MSPLAATEVRLVEQRGGGAMDGVVAAESEPVGEIGGDPDEPFVDVDQPDLDEEIVEQVAGTSGLVADETAAPFATRERRRGLDVQEAGRRRPRRRSARSQGTPRSSDSATSMIGTNAEVSR